jgi:cobalt-zinc-cadmium resistance protein CzcA
MLLGANSRTVAKDVDAQMKLIQQSLPPGIKIKAVLNRTKLVDATIETVKKNLIEGAILVIVVLFLMLGNFRAALICALAIPLAMLMTVSGMVHTKISGNLMSLGAIDFGLIVDGAVIIVENCLRLLAEKQHELGRTLTLQERLDTVLKASTQVRSATAFGEAIIITVYFPILALSGIEGKMFQPMAFTVIFALIAAFILSLTFVPAMVAIFVTGKVQEKENPLVAFAKRGYEPVLRWALRWRYAVVGLGVASFVGALLLFGTLGQEFVPTLDEKDLATHAMRIPSTGISKSTEMQF